jgi:hypothetical protein
MSPIRASVRSALFGTVATLLIVGALLTADRTVFHWYVPDRTEIRNTDVAQNRSLENMLSGLNQIDERLDRVERCLDQGLSVNVSDVYIYNFPYGEGQGETDPC